MNFMHLRWQQRLAAYARSVRLLALGIAGSIVLACGDSGAAGPIRVKVEGARTVITTQSELIAHPTDLVLDRSGTLYVLDGQNNRILVIDTAGEVQRQFGRGGAGPEELERPTGIAVQEDTVVVLDRGNGRIQRWLSTGQHVGTQNQEEFSGGGPTALHATGALAVGTMGEGDVLVNILDKHGQLVGGLRAPITPPVAIVNFTELKSEISAGVVPAFLRNIAVPVWHNDSEVWLLLQTENTVERYSVTGTLKSSTQLELPEAEAIRAAFFKRNEEGAGLPQLAYAADGVVVENMLWILLNLPADSPAVIVRIEEEGNVFQILEFPEITGARSFAVDRAAQRIYFGVSTTAEILAVDLENSPVR